MLPSGASKPGCENARPQSGPDWGRSDHSVCALRTEPHYEGRRKLPLRRHHLRGGGRPGKGDDLPLHRLPDAVGLVLSHGSPDRRRELPAAIGRTQGLRQDRRERQEASAGVLPGNAARRSTPHWTAVQQRCTACASAPFDNAISSCRRCRYGRARRNTGSTTWPRFARSRSSRRDRGACAHRVSATAITSPLG